MISGALTRSFRESDTALITCTPSSSTAAETRANGPSRLPVAEVVDDGRVGLPVEPLEPGCPDLHVADAKDITFRKRPARRWPPCVFSSSFSRRRSLISSRMLRVLVHQGPPVGLGRLLQLLEDPLVLAGAVDGRLAGEGLHPAGAGGDALLGGDQEQADVAGLADVGAAAELLGEAGDLDHPHPLAVLVAEEGQRAVGRGPPRGP